MQYFPPSEAAARLGSRALAARPAVSARRLAARDRVRSDGGALCGNAAQTAQPAPCRRPAPRPCTSAALFAFNIPVAVAVPYRARTATASPSGAQRSQRPPVVPPSCSARAPTGPPQPQPRACDGPSARYVTPSEAQRRPATPQPVTRAVRQARARTPRGPVSECE